MLDFLKQQYTGIKAANFPANLKWLNSKEIDLDKLKGKVILIDFWTYSCINCQRTLPYLKNWWEKYQNLGLVIIGVHTPEFDFEKDIDNVKNALKKYNVTWPVVLDNDYVIWNSYANHYWPAKYLIDQSSKIIYTHFGEGNYPETELKIQQALSDAGFKVPQNIAGTLLEEGVSSEQTPELYFGLLRGEVIRIDDSHNAEGLKENQIYAKGEWDQQEEYLEHSRETEDLLDLIILKYKARKVYLVMESNTKDPAKVYITLDGVGLKGNGAGRDIQFDPKNRAYVLVQFSTLYNVIETPSFGNHILRISTTSKDFRCFAFTFGS